MRLTSLDDAGNKSTILTHTPPSGFGGGATSPATSSSMDLLSPSASELGGDMLSLSTRSFGALCAMRPALAWLAARAPILMPAQTPRATPPPISTAELRRAPWVV